MGMIISPHRFAAAGGTTWTAVRTAATPHTSTGWSGWAFRQRMGAPSLTDIVGDHVRLTITSAATTGLVVGECWFGKAGAGAFDFDGTQVQVTFDGGNAGATRGTSTDLVSDSIPFAYTGTDDLMAFYYFSGATDLVFYTGVTNAANSQRNFNDHGSTTASGYAGSAFDNAIRVVEAFV